MSNNANREEVMELAVKLILDGLDEYHKTLLKDMDIHFQLESMSLICKIDGQRYSKVVGN